jgi:hypothetical protein
VTRPHSTTRTTADNPAPKPAKPYPAFPLIAHPAGQWVKKIRGKLYSFGVWADPDAALKKYFDQKDALHAGRKPRVESEGLTIRDLGNRFLNAKLASVLTAVDGADQRQQLQDLAQDNHRLRAECDRLQQQLQQAVVLNADRLACFATTAQAEGVSLHVARRLLRPLRA